MKKHLTNAGILLLACLLLPLSVLSQRRNKSQSTLPTYPEELYSSLDYRLIGPFRGGRSAAVTGVPGEPNLFYFGAAGGGVWKTLDGGRTWNNISDGYFGGSIGEIPRSVPLTHQAIPSPSSV